jgi:hypothetical protein
MKRLGLAAFYFPITSLAVGLLVGACNAAQERAVVNETVLTGVEEKEPAIPADMLSLESDTASVPTDLPPSEHLFGKFFNDRAEFFVIEKPSNTLYESGIHSITLYHLDGRLLQTKYVVKDNIESRLLKHLGPCKITPLDSTSKVVVATQRLVTSDNNILMMNPKLTHYELKWVVADNLVRYRVNKNRIKEAYVYLESSKVYAQEMKEIERAAIF